MTPADAVTLETYGSLIEAQLARGKLEAHGIPAMIDERWLSFEPVLPAAAGGIRLLVPPSAAEEARRILADREPAGPEACPVCGSEDVEVRRGAVRMAWLALLLFALPLGRSRPRRVCRFCGHHWRA